MPFSLATTSMLLTRNGWKPCQVIVQQNEEIAVWDSRERALRYLTPKFTPSAHAGVFLQVHLANLQGDKIFAQLKRQYKVASWENSYQHGWEWAFTAGYGTQFTAIQHAIFEIASVRQLDDEKVVAQVDLELEGTHNVIIDGLMIKYDA